MKDELRNSGDDTTFPHQEPDPENPFADNSAVTDDFNSEAGSGEDINILRDKTFNPELRNLVDRIKGNEPTEVVFDEAVNEIDRCSDDELLVQLYRLFYMAKNLYDNGEINISFNPLPFRKKKTDEEISAAINMYIKKEMEGMSFPDYAFLTYNLEERAYSIADNHLNGHNSESVVISMWDSLFNDIQNSPDGILLEIEEINLDPFLKKKFSNDDGSVAPVFLVSLSHLVSVLNNELDYINYEDHPPQSFIPSPILMIRFETESYGLNNKGISAKLRENLIIPIFHYQYGIRYTSRYESERNLEFTFNSLDHILTLFLLHDEAYGILISARGKYKKEISFLMKYIISKCYRIIKPDSAVIHIAKNRLLILSDRGGVDEIKKFIQEYNKLFMDNFDILIFKNSEFTNPDDIVTGIIFK